MEHSPKAEGDGFQNREEAGCAGTRRLSLPSTCSSTTALSLEEARSPHPLGTSVQRSAPQRQGEKRPSSALFQVAVAVGPYHAPGGPALGALAPPSLVPLREQLCLTNSFPPPGSRLPLVG